MKKILTLLASLFLAINVYAGEKIADISIAELKSAIDAKQVVLLDANGSQSWKEGHIPGAVDFSTTKDDLASVLPKDKNALVVAYCGGPKCQAYKAAAEAAKKLGYTNVKHLSAGISGWTEAKEAVEKAN
jgi:rhodanese-related sulfurtransferase